MPTGYTAAIKDGITFDKFVWSCARAMGALIMMRDEPGNAPIPQRFEPSDCYAEWLADARAELARLQAMSIEEVEAAAKAAHATTLADNKRRRAEATALREKYEAMLEQVTAWTPPTAEHVGFKKFMTEQITESIKFDCGTSYYADPPPIEPTTWHNEQMDSRRKMIARYESEHAAEVERTEGRNAWIDALRESVPPAA